MCSIDGCGKKVQARGWCSRHYSLWRKNGNPTEQAYKIEPPYVVRDEDPLLWAWAAGFFDGEGTSFVKNGTTLTVSAPQNDPEVLEKLLNAVGVGRVNGPYQNKREGSKPYWVYRAHGKAGIVALAKMWKWLGTAKKKQALSAMEKL